jgi:hypothetical protein
MFVRSIAGATTERRGAGGAAGAGTGAGIGACIDAPFDGTVRGSATRVPAEAGRMMRGFSGAGSTGAGIGAESAAETAADTQLGEHRPEVLAFGRDDDRLVDVEDDVRVGVDCLGRLGPADLFREVEHGHRRGTRAAA